MAGVVFSRSRISLQLWFYAMLHFANSAESVTGPFLGRQLEVSEPTAFRLAHRIRWHMAALDDQIQIGRAGTPVVIRLTKILRVINRQANTQNSAMVLLICDGTRVDSTVIVRPRKKEIHAIVRAKVNPLSHLVTDCHWTLRVVGAYGSARPIAEYVPDFYLGRAGSENQNQGFMQYFNLSFSNQFRGVSLENAWLYLKEYEFRYNRRNRSAETFRDLVSRFPSFDQKNLDRIKARNFIIPRPR